MYLLVTSLFIYSIVAYNHVLSLNRFCQERSNGIPRKVLIEQTEKLSFLTEKNIKNGYVLQETWIHERVVLDSLLAPKLFACSISVGVSRDQTSTPVTLGYEAIESIDLVFFELKLL